MIKTLVRRKSKIHGFGIFANRDIAKGEDFYEIPLSSISKKPRPRHAFIGKNSWVNDPQVLNYINHSCDSNIKLDISKEKPILIAKRDIKKGEEMTCDYNETEKGGNKVACNCGSKKCRGYFIRIE